MKLGILVNTDRHLRDVLGTTRAALAGGHEVVIFVMDEGTRLLKDSEFAGLCGLQGVTMSFCDHSAQQLKVETGVPEEIVCGSQYNHAMMLHAVDRLVVL